MIVVTGTVAFDYILDFEGRFADYILPEKLHQINISFLTEQAQRQFGGTAGNQAYTLALLGNKPYLFTTVGSDFTQYREYLERVGVVTQYVKVIPDKTTAVGFAITDQADNQIWGFASAAAAAVRKLKLQDFFTQLDKEAVQPKEVFVVLAPQDERVMINWAQECQQLGIDYLFDPAFQLPKMDAGGLRQAVGGAKVLFGNDYEIATLLTKLNLRIDQLQNLRGRLQVVVETLGAAGSVIYDLPRQRRLNIKAARVTKVVDPTGAGDAYRAGFLAGYLQGFDLQTCGQMGSVAAAYAIEKYGTINHSFTPAEFWQRYTQNYGSTHQRS